MWAKVSWGLVNLDNVEFIYKNKTSEDVEIVAFFESGVTKVVKKVNTEEEADKFIVALHNRIEYHEALNILI
jgi:hypothetical protein